MKIRVNLGSRSFEVGYKIWSKEAYDELRKTNSDEDILDSMIDDEDIIVNEYDLSGGGINVAVYDGKSAEYFDGWISGKGMSAYKQDFSSGKLVETCLA